MTRVARRTRSSIAAVSSAIATLRVRASKRTVRLLSSAASWISCPRRRHSPSSALRRSTTAWGSSSSLLASASSASASVTAWSAAGRSLASILLAALRHALKIWACAMAMVRRSSSVRPMSGSSPVTGPAPGAVVSGAGPASAVASRRPPSCRPALEFPACPGVGHRGRTLPPLVQLGAGRRDVVCGLAGDT